MGGEYVLAQDPLNFHNELSYQVFHGYLNDLDLKDLLFEGFINQTEYDDMIDLYNFLNGECDD